MCHESKLPPEEGSPEVSQPLAGGIADRRGDHTKRGKLGKLLRMLSVFASGIRLNTFEAKEIGDTCLHTTVSDLAKRYGVHFAGEWEKVRNRFGTDTRVKRYWLEGQALERAQAIINGRAQP